MPLPTAINGSQSLLLEEKVDAKQPDEVFSLEKYIGRKT